MSTTSTKPDAVIIDKKDKKRKGSSTTEELSKDYKKPRTLKDFIVKNKEDKPSVVKRTETPSNRQTWRPEDITTITTGIERIIGQQERAQACIERLLELFLQEGREDSSAEEGLIKEYKEP